jgi:outer membrane protein assembly factor BamB
VSHSRRQVLGLAGIAMACAAGAGAGIATGWAYEARGRADTARARQRPATDHHLEPLWRFRVANPEDTVLTAAGPIVYVNCQAENKLYSLRADDGSVMWEAPAAPAAPATHGPLVYFFEVDWGLSVRSIASGERQWDFPGTAGSIPVFYASAAYVSGAADPADKAGAIWALDAQTGRPIWQAPSVNGDSPIVVTDETVFTYTDGSLIRALSRRDGTELWRYDYPDFSDSQSPQVVKDIVYGSYTYSTSNQSVLFALNASNGSTLWTLTYPNLVFAMDAVDGMIYVAGSGSGLSGIGSTALVSALAAENGRRVWRRTLHDLDQTFLISGRTALISVSPSGAFGGIAYPGSAGGETELRALRLSDGAASWQVTGAGWSLTSPPSLMGELACVGFTDESIRVVNAETGETKWDLPMAVVSGPVANNGLVFAVEADAVGPDGDVSAGGTVYAVPA